MVDIQSGTVTHMTTTVIPLDGIRAQDNSDFQISLLPPTTNRIATTVSVIVVQVGRRGAVALFQAGPVVG